MYPSRVSGEESAWEPRLSQEGVCPRARGIWGGFGAREGAEFCGSLGALTLAAALVRGQLVPRVTAALVAAQGVEAPLLTAPAVGPRALVHLCQLEGKSVSASQGLGPSSCFLLKSQVQRPSGFL